MEREEYKSSDQGTGSRLRWSTEMETLLVDIWQESIDDLRGARKNSHIYMEMANSMREAGLEMKWVDIRTKLENLTRKYKTEKNKVVPSGGAPSGWKHYEKLNSFRGSFWIHNMEQNTVDNHNKEKFFLSDNIIEVDLDGSCSSSTFSASNEPPSKRAKVDYMAILANVATARLEEQQENHRKQDERAEKREAQMDRLIDSQTKFQNDMLSFFMNRNK